MDLPPPLTASKRRDPLRDGLVFEQRPAPSEQGTVGALQLFRPSPAPAPADALLRSAAKAAAINRSAEAQHIKRSWDALVGASPLPATVRQVFSPAATQPQLAAFRSPAVPAPFLFRPYSQPAPGLPGRLPFALGASAAAGEPLPAPAALYRSAVQQQRQQHYSHQGLPQQPFIAQQQQQQQQQQQAVGGEVEASKYARVVHAHSPSYQAVVSSTVEVVRQSAAPLPGAPQLHFAQPAAHYAALGAAAGVPPPLGDSGGAKSGVILEELPPGRGVAGAQGRSAQQQQQQQQQPERSSLPMRLLPQQPLVVLQVPLMEQPLGPAQPPERASQPQLSPPAGEAQESHFRLPGTASLEQAMGVVGNLVRDLCSPTPETPGDLGGDQQQSGQLPPLELAAPSSEGPGQHLGAEAAARAAPQPGSPPPQVGTDGAAAPADAQPGVDMASPMCSFEAAVQQQQQQVPAAPEPHDSAATGAGGAEGPVGEKGEAPGAPAPASQSQPSSNKGGSKGPKKRAGADATAERTGKRRMQLRADSATVQPALRSVGEAPLGVETTRSGRARIKPLPYWTNSRQVFNVKREVVGIEHKADLLGLSGEAPPRPASAPKGAKVKVEPGSAKSAAAAKAKAGEKAGSAAAKPRAARATAPASARQPPGKGKQGRQPAAAQQQAEAHKSAPAPSSGPGRAKARSAAARQPAAAAVAKARGAAAVQPAASAAAGASGKQVAQRRQQGKAAAPKEGRAELEAAKQLQQLGQGEASPSRGRRPAAPKKPATAAAASSLPAAAAGRSLAALAASAGARAAKEAAQQTAGAATATGKQRGKATAGSGAAAAAGEGPAGQSASALPVVEGVAAEVVQHLAQLSPHARWKCGQCKHCLKPSAKKACLVRHALQERAGPLGPTDGAMASVQQPEQQPEAGRKERDPPGPKPKQPREGPGAASPQKARVPKGGKRAAQPAGAAAGRKAKREGESASQDAPPAKRAKTGRAAQRQRQQLAEGPEQEEHVQADVGQPTAAGEVAPRGNEEETDEQGWTASQAAALQRAWIQIEPTASNFWHLVAQQVPGKTATECYNRHMGRHPTPPHAGRKAAPKKYLAAAQGGAQMPELKPGASKKVLQNAARKYARQLQWQQKAERAQAVGGEEGLGEELLEEMEAAERKDRYIDQILRKRAGRPLGMAPRGRKAAAPAAAAGAAGLAQQAGGGRKSAAADSEREVRAALADLGPQHDQEEDRDSQEDSDYYWSDG